MAIGTSKEYQKRAYNTADWTTIDQACELLGIKKKKLFNMVSSAKIPDRYLVWE